MSSLPQAATDPEAAIAAMAQWYHDEAFALRSPRALVAQTCRRFRAHGVPLERFTAFLLTLHPDYFGVAQRWRADTGEVTTGFGSHAIWNSPTLMDSPYGLIRDGYAAARRRLAGPGARIDFAVLGELAEAGMTDYVIMHLPFSDGRRHAVAFATARPEGFAAGDLFLFDAMLSRMGRASEILTLRHLATTLLDVYVGRQSGERVLTGQIRRGSGETVAALIWMSDLRGFTALSDRLPRDALIALLNGYFDAVGGPIERAGGEILKFIGDAILAIWPLGPGAAAGDICRRALAAAAEARAALPGLREKHAAPGLDFGIGLHRGDVLYGNIGTSRRLDFTVIGPAVNLAARIESLTATIAEPILFSAAVAEALGAARPLGRHALKGMAEPVAVFAPAGAE